MLELCKSYSKVGVPVMYIPTCTYVQCTCMCACMCKHVAARALARTKLKGGGDLP